MDLGDALAKDKGMTERFLAAIAAKAQLDVSIISKSDRCILGNWLHGEGERKYPFLRTFKPCVETHAAFHAQAAKVVRQINGGEYEDAQAMIADNTPYAKALSALETATMLLKKEAHL